MGQTDGSCTPILALCLPAIGATTPLILGRICAVLAGTSDVSKRETVEIALAEVLNNVVEHGCNAACGAVALKLSLTKTKIAVTVTDWGQPYPESAIPDGNPPDPYALEEGGYGWFLIKSLATDIRYTRIKQTNHLYLKFPI